MAITNQILPIPLSTLKPATTTVGCLRLDELLRGGLLCGTITELTGEFASGKTQFCMQCCLGVQWPVSVGGLNGKAIYIYTEGTPPGKRLEEIAVEQWRMGKGNGVAALDNILISEVASVEELWVCLNQLPGLLEGERGGQRQVRLVVIDSIANIFREVSDRPSFFQRGCVPKVDELRERTNRMFEMASLLKKLAHEWNLAVLITNQVVDVLPNATKSPESVIQSLGRGVLPSLGLSWANCVNTRLVASRQLHGEVLLRNLQVAFSPHLCKSSCMYEIRKAGIVGLPEAMEVQANIR